MKLHILGINYAPEFISTGVYTTGLAQDMARRGHDVTVVTSHPHYPAWKVWDGWPRFTYRSCRGDDGIAVIHCPLYVPPRPTAKSRMAHYLSFAISALPRLTWRAFRDRPDIVLVVAPSLISALTGIVAARLTGAKLWLHVQDFEVEAAFATGAINPEGRIGHAAQTFERWVFSRFDRISTISKPMLTKLREKGVPDRNIVELRNWANINRVTVVPGRSPLRDEVGITTPYVAYYSGNIAAKQGIEIIPVAAHILKDRHDLTFVICGEGPYLDELQARAEGLRNILFLPLQPLDKLSDALGMADIHLLPQIAGVADLVLPSKLTNMLASGRPVLATTLPETALANEIAGAGVITPPGDAEAFAAAIETLLDDPALRTRLGAVARDHAVNRWDMEAILGRFEEQLAELVRT
ncbi:MAG: WcaI family glycosyltransferase [Alphaproteobacteria bacterium]|nr:WcaI family glycosyltransferase [Alphaproteobacteria bacterium]